MITKILYQDNVINISLNNDIKYGEIIRKSLDIYNIYIYCLKDIIAKDNEDKELFKFSNVELNSTNEFNFTKLELIGISYNNDNIVLLNCLTVKYMNYLENIRWITNDTTDNTLNDITDNTSNDTIDNTSNDTIDNTSNDTIDNISNDTIDNISNDTTDNISNDTIDHTSNDTINNSLNDAIDNSENIIWITDTIDNLHNHSILNLNINIFRYVRLYVPIYNYIYDMEEEMEEEMEDILIVGKKEEVDSIDSILFKQIVELNDIYLSECAICLDKFNDNDECLYFKNCKHNYHTLCIKNHLLNYSNKCPLCRCELVKGIIK